MGKKKYDSRCKFCGATPIRFRFGGPYRCMTCGALQKEKKIEDKKKT